MNLRSPLLALVLAFACVGLMAGPARSQSRVVAENAFLAQMLDEIIETKDFTNPMSFKDAMQLFYEKFAAKGKELPILVNLDSFKVDDSNESQTPYDAQVQLPTVPKQMPMHVALRIILDQVRGKATYVIRQGHVDIVHPSHATAKVLLQQRVLTRFDKVILRGALDDLAAITGAPIVFDVRAKEKGQEKVSIVLNNMTLEDSLIVLTEQAGLRFVTLESGIFVTSPEDAKNIEERQKKRVATPPTQVEKRAPAAI
jgi:hypothetical protein